ncbi:hypothetical protein HGRIS_010187 [Hohenbuehelia grisea]|uniref:Phosphomethylpyrimidine kinase n=1 Tax=Hohenbuehelia grisea TaxID=104357 RepID=A0ABR3J3I1_9AGAR
MAPQNLLTIAGTDPSGGAGIQADLRTFAAFGQYGTSAITALVAQNTLGVQDIMPSTPEFLEKQIRAVLDDITIHGIKTGMLYDATNARTVVKTLKSHYGNDTKKMPPLVCDPVSVSTSGHTLLQPDAVGVLINEVFPISTIITPNKSEAELLLSHQQDQKFEITDLEGMIEAASRLLSYGSKSCLLKGGHITVTQEDIDGACKQHQHIGVVREGLLEENMEILQLEGGNVGQPDPLVVDVLHQGNDRVTLYVRPHIESSSTHGTGCTLSATLAAELGRELPVDEAVRSATAYTHRGIETAYPIGHGHGPLNHLHSITKTYLPVATRTNPYPFTRFLIQSTRTLWKQYVEHDFVKQLGRGELRREAFVHFIKQDYHYLKYYARAHGLLAAKSTRFNQIKTSANIILHIIQEIGTHTSFCKQFGVSLEELEATPESAATVAYGSYLIDVGLQGDTSKLTMALLACLLGYGEVGLWLKKEASKPESWVNLSSNPYVKWIEDYSGPEYQEAVKIGLKTVEEQALSDPPSETRLNEWCEVWRKCTWFEKCFWDMAFTETAYNSRQQA